MENVSLVVPSSSITLTVKRGRERAASRRAWAARRAVWRLVQVLRRMSLKGDAGVRGEAAGELLEDLNRRVGDMGLAEELGVNVKGDELSDCSILKDAVWVVQSSKGPQSRETARGDAPGKDVVCGIDASRYGIIQSAKLSFSGMTGGKAWTSEKLTRFLRLDKMRARTAREVIGECRRVNLRRGVLADSVANADRPLEVMPLMWESTGKSLEIGTCHNERCYEILVLGDASAFGCDLGRWDFERADDSGDVRVRAEDAAEHTDPDALRHLELLFVDGRILAYKLNVLVPE
ncbi:hypothetical protein HG530_004990 [Fusarium avenaceum]|nr:hypothetical protein HG530_004990 [Fusarium avenaceum]